MGLYVWIHNFLCILEDIFKLDIQQMSHCISVKVSVFLFVAIFALIVLWMTTTSATLQNSSKKETDQGFFGRIVSTKWRMFFEVVKI